MTLQQLQSVMKYHLKNFNNEGVTISNDTIHEAVLSDSDGFGNANSKTIYRAVIRWTMKREGHDDKPWPDNWMKKTVKDLSDAIL